MAQSATRPAVDPAQMPMGEVLGAIREELGELAASARQVEGLLADLVAKVEPDVVASVVTDAQMIDALSQRLEAMEIYVRALRGLVPQHWELDPRPASSLLTLSKLASRLTRQEDEDLESGELELF